MLGESSQVEIDLGAFGKFLCFDRSFSFEPLLKAKTSLSVKQTTQSKKTVRSLMELQKRKTQVRTMGRPENTEEAVEAVEGEEMSPFSKMQKSSVQAITKAPSLTRLAGPEQPYHTPTRRFNRPDSINLIPEMLGAGTDPLAKNQDFSRLVGNPKALITSSFLKPGNAKIRFPPILDKFARTLAAPISGMKFNTSVVGRIASNYNPSARRLYFDNDSKGVKLLRSFDSKVNFTANSELLQKPATLEEELMFLTGKTSS